MVTHEREWQRGASCCQTSRPSILFGIVSDSGKKAHTIALANVAFWATQLAKSIANATFVYVLYDNQAARWTDVQSTAAMLGVQLYLINGNFSPSTYQPKLMLQQRIFTCRGCPDANRFSAVWLPDADISFSWGRSKFDTKSFLRRWACAFEGGPPIIAQPTIEPRTNFWIFSHREYGHITGRMRHTGMQALHTAFVEQQAPLLDGAFASWFMSSVAPTLAAMQAKYSSTWGTDRLWCGAAEEYAAIQWSIANQNDSKQHQTKRVGCAVILGKLMHKDTKTLPHWHDVDTARRFKAGGVLVNRAAHARWPTWFLNLRLLHLYRGSVEHAGGRLHNDQCMVQHYGVSRLGRHCALREMR